MSTVDRSHGHNSKEDMAFIRIKLKILQWSRGKVGTWDKLEWKTLISTGYKMLDVMQTSI